MVRLFDKELRDDLVSHIFAESVSELPVNGYMIKGILVKDYSCGDWLDVRFDCEKGWTICRSEKL